MRLEKVLTATQLLNRIGVTPNLIKKMHLVDSRQYGDILYTVLKPKASCFSRPAMVAQYGKRSVL